MTSDPDRYAVPARVGRDTHTESGSKFIALAAPARTRADAEQILDGERRRYHDATHHCYAWSVTDDERSADAGEPSGTAGAPILEAIRAAALQEVAVVVTRYFGGTKLGTGGLRRAYGAAARAALQAAGKSERQRTREVLVSFAHPDTAAVHHVASRFDARQVGAAYAEQVALRFELAASRAEEFCRALTEGTHGRAKAHVT